MYNCDFTKWLLNQGPSNINLRKMELCPFKCATGLCLTNIAMI